MKTLKTTKSWIFGAALIVAAQGTSQAGLSYFDISYYADYGVTVKAQNFTHTTLATAFSANRTAGAALPINHTDPFVTFCLDINTSLASGWWQSGGFSAVPSTTTIGDPNNPTGPAIRNVTSGLNSAANLYKHYAGGVGHASGNGSTMVWDNKLDGAALQLAIWEVLYDTTGTYNVNQDGSAGNNANEFYVSSGSTAVRNRANAMLAAWSSPDWSTDTTFWNAVTSSGAFRSSQDLIGPFAPVPEPGTFIAGGLLLLPFLASTLRRKFGK